MQRAQRGWEFGTLFKVQFLPSEKAAFMPMGFEKVQGKCLFATKDTELLDYSAQGRRLFHQDFGLARFQTASLFTLNSFCQARHMEEKNSWRKCALRGCCQYLILLPGRASTKRPHRSWETKSLKTADKKPAGTQMVSAWSLARAEPRSSSMDIHYGPTSSANQAQLPRYDHCTGKSDLWWLAGNSMSFNLTIALLEGSFGHLALGTGQKVLLAFHIRFSGQDEDLLH